MVEYHIIAWGACIVCMVLDNMRTEIGQPTDTGGRPHGLSLVPELRKALRNLYINAELRRSALVELLGLDGGDSASALREALLQAIDALKPGNDAPRSAKAWRLYDVLFHLYVQQFSQKEVATALSLSTRQLRRHESLALQALADHILSRAAPRRAEPGLAQAGAPGEGSGASSREQELAWLGRSASPEVVDLGEVVQAVLRITEPLVRSLGARVECQVAAGFCRVAAHPVTLRQALLNALTATVRSVPGGNVTITAEVGDHQIALLLQPEGHRAPLPSSAMLLESLEISRQLLALSGGSLEIAEGEGGQPFAVRLTLALAGQIAVLVVDDNADTLALLRRYLTGSPYAFYGTTDPGLAPALAEQVGARIIVLDLMLPGIDGWELLARLREHPRTRRVPIIVCSILPEEELALTLGAADFVRKPVTRSALLAALDRQAQELTTGSC